MARGLDAGELRSALQLRAEVAPLRHEIQASTGAWLVASIAPFRAPLHPASHGIAPTPLGQLLLHGVGSLLGAYLGCQRRAQFSAFARLRGSARALLRQSGIRAIVNGRFGGLPVKRDEVSWPSVTQ